MPTVYQMIGLPGSGKSTFIKNHHILSTLPVISTDNHVEEYARICNKTYSEVFNDYMPMAVGLMMDDVKLIRQRRVDCIWDQTSTTIASRRKKFKHLPSYRHVAIWLKTPPNNVLEERLRCRPGKDIPKDVIESMIKAFEIPTTNEGFEEVWEVEYNRTVN